MSALGFSYELLDRDRKQSGLREEADGGARLDQVRQVRLRVHGDEDEMARPQAGVGRVALHQIESALPVHLDVDDCHVRAQRAHATDRLLGGGRHADDPETSGLEQGAGARRAEEARVVVDDQAARRHSVRLEPWDPAAIPASRQREPSQGPTHAPIMLVVDGSRGRVVLADDDVLLREGLGRLLTNAGFEVVERCGDADQLLRAVREHRPDLVVVDIRMPPTQTTEGLDAARTIRREFPEMAIMLLSAHAEVEEATELLAGGRRSGYLLKDRVTDVDEFTASLDRVIGGGAVVEPALVQELLAARRVKDPLRALSDREREVLALMAEGRSNAGIARQLWVTEGTVEKHVRSILMKLHIQEADDDHRRVLAVLTFLDSH